MAIEAFKLANSGSLRTGRERSDESETYRVKGVSNVFAAINALIAAFPETEQGEPHPDKPEYLLADYLVDHVPDTMDHWDVDCLYESATISGGPLELPDARPRISRQIQPIEIWRIPGLTSGFKFPGGIDSPTQGATTGADIGGIGVDKAGEPIDLGFVFHEITFSYEILGLPNEQMIWRMMRRRNNTSFHVYPAGSVLYLGADTDPTGRNRYRVTHHMVADELFHLRQRVPVESDGLVLTTTSSGNATATYVNWWQPFPLRGPFGLLNIPGISG